MDDEEAEELVVRDARTGEIFARFDTPRDKKNFLRTLGNFVDKLDRNKEEGYRCKDCAAYPCFRGRGGEERAGGCFQNVRQCRQECKFYLSNTIDGTAAPGFGGKCKLDEVNVEYNQECHIERIKKSRLPEDLGDLKLSLDK